MIRLSLLFLICFLAAFPAARAQVNPGPCDTCYRAYAYDSTFSLGGHLVPSVDDGIDRFNFVFSQEYFTDAPDVGRNLVDSFALRWIADGGHPWGGYWVDSAALLVSLPVNHPGRIAAALRQRRYRAARERGFKFIIHPGHLGGIMKSASVWENYLVQPPDFQSFLQCEFPPQESAGIPSWQTGEWRRDYLDPLTGGFYWSYTVSSSLTPDTVLMVGRPDWVGNAFGIDPSSQGLYDAVYHIWTDAEGNARPAGIADSLAAIYDKRKWMSVEFAMNADTSELSNPLIPDTAVIAYADLFVRDRQEQTGCKCRLMKFWKRIEITKSEYLERFNAEDAEGKKKYQAIFDPETNRTYFDIDTVIDFGPVWEGAGGYFGEPTGGEFCEDYCDSLLGARTALSTTDTLYLPPGSYQASYADLADFSFRFYTTRIVQVGFLRSRIARHSFSELRNGVYDSLIAYAVDSLYGTPGVDSVVDRIGIGDEVGNAQHRAWGLLSSKVQRAMQINPLGAVRPKSLWANPPHNVDAFRLFAGDFDSVAYKQIHMAARQRYLIGSATPIPIFYANIDSLGGKARDTMFKFRLSDTIVNGDTVRRNLITGNNLSEYRHYRDWEQESYGKFLDYRNFSAGDPNSTNSQGPMIPAIGRLVDVMRFKYRDRFPDVPSSPVWNVVQTHGHVSLGAGDWDATGFNLGFGDTRIPTPEQITVQAWLAVNSGVTGLVFGDFIFTGTAMGLTSEHFSPTSSVSELEYGRLRSTNQGAYPDNIMKYRVDSMWLGFRSRAAAVEEVTGELRYIDSVIGLSNLDYRQEQMSVHDMRVSFDGIPMVRDLKAERAKRYEAAFDTAAGTWSFTGSDTLDAREETFMEISSFRVRSDAVEYQTGTRLLIITNRLTWPIDTNVYSATTVALFDSLHPWFPTGNRGLGAIDVRRPVVVFENNTEVIADRLIVEKLSPSNHWIDTVAFGDTVRLPWHLPGRGAAYLLTPIPALLSDLGTAYNNAVRSENPSSDTLARDRMVVYERDSVVYIRSIDSAGAWSAEVLLSDPADTAVVNGKRIASSFFPALATCRNNEGATRVVWERRDTLGRHSVESIVLFENRISRMNLAAVVDSFSARHQLLPPSYPEGPPNLTPAIVGVHDTAGTGGFVVAWAGPDTGVTVLAIREIPDGTDFLAWQDTTSVRRLHANVPLDSVCQYPTLAHVPRFERMNGSTARLAGSDPEKETDPLTEESLYWLNRVHLAYQQGDGDEGVGEQIYYHPVGVIFPDQTLSPPGLLVGWYEPVTRKIDACSFVHPSIAADSARVGVAFEIVEANAGQRNIGLRFRDTAGSNLGAPLKAWETTLYRWGGPLTRVQKMFGLGAVYERPSLTEFPSMDSLSLAFSPEGGLTWYWSNGPAGRAFPQWLYRYGWFGPREIGDGKHPGMMLVPYIGANPFEETGIFHRGTDSAREAGINDAGDAVWRYPSRLLNTPGNPIGYFSTITGGSGIVAGATVAASPSGCNVQRRMDFGIVFSYGSVTHPVDDHFPPGDPPVPPSKPGLPPTFFAPPGGGTTLVDTLSTAWQVVRTSLFITGNEPVALRRVAGGGDSLSEWLDIYGWDTARSVPANVWATLELVRAADSSVLWRSDTIDARGLDTLDDPLDDILGVPVNTVTDSGTIAFIRMQFFATEKVVYDLHGGFRFYTEDSTAGGFEKVHRPQIEEGSRATAGESQLSILVLPNPARERAEVRVHAARGGRVRLSVWSMRGERLAELPDLEAEYGGEYKVEVSLAAVPAGTYLLRAESDDAETSLRFNVVR